MTEYPIFFGGFSAHKNSPVNSSAAAWRCVSARQR